MCEQSYILRVYRYAEKDSGEPVIDGIVEIPASGRRVAFHSINELWSILTSCARQEKKDETDNKAS